MVYDVELECGRNKSHLAATHNHAYSVCYMSLPEYFLFKPLTYISQLPLLVVVESWRLSDRNRGRSRCIRTTETWRAATRARRTPSTE